MIFGQWVRIERKKRNWFLRDLAKTSGYSKQHLGKIERGIAAPTIFTASVIANTFGYKLWQVLKILEE